MTTALTLGHAIWLSRKLSVFPFCALGPNLNGHFMECIEVADVTALGHSVK